MATAEQAPRVRRTAADRRKQLIGIGLELLIDRPFHQFTIDDVAAKAGISRSLLFHYFPSKRDYYMAVVRAAMRRMLRATRAEPGTPAEDQLAAIIGGYASFIQRRRAPYVALFRGT